MNTYYISRSATYTEDFEVEAVDESEAIDVVEFCEPVDKQFEYAENTHVTDVKYGETKWSLTLKVGIVTEGNIEGDSLRDLVSKTLMPLDELTLREGDVACWVEGVDIGDLVSEE